ncbi:MAG: hypothetical protein AAGC97_09140 [Planctomycetota bacterium]
MMKLMRFFVTLGLVCSLVGCDLEGPEAVSSSSTGEIHDHDHGHPHPHGHDHDSEVNHSVQGHAHGVGPHGGTIVDWGGGTYHVELTTDQGQQEAVVYILGGDEKTPVPIDADSVQVAIQSPPIHLVLNRDPLPDDPAGKSSRYTGTDPSLSDVADHAGTITGVVEGTPYSGDYQLANHATHEH